MKTSNLFHKALPLMAAAFVATTATAAAAQEVTLTFAHIFQPGHSISDGVDDFAAKIGEATNGRVAINVVPAGALGGMDSNLEGLSLGSLDMTIAGESYTSQYYPPMAVTAAPYAFQSDAHFDAYVGSELYNEFAAAFEEATGNRIIGTFTTGFRNVTANKAIREPADMQGLKIRVPDAPMFTAMPRAVGASPTPIAFAEVYLALQQGVVDAQENPLDTINSMKFQEVQDYVNLTQHMMEPAHLVISQNALGKLSAEDRQTLVDIGAEIGREITADARQRNADLVGVFASEGVTVVKDVDIAAFASAVRDFNTSSERNWTSEQFDRLQALAD